ncbi:tyrosine-protein phosphatase [Bifidobacterium sp. ESL0798]|uniref:tyrosine-protein phosphatase n=1 Tax=Bifidobacterium sp. ESL0798 TaxID=2983235 RepID=UPI0023F94AC4|nr:tyrosine-protein phosphatase [Bifidobacterium sp. ESL0798]WEV73903.1 tyrosine-protein phosphatase [Bifidobacterium sp. ESL0798]
MTSSQTQATSDRGSVSQGAGADTPGDISGITGEDYLGYRPVGDGAGVEIDGVPNSRGIGGYPTADGHKLRGGLFFRTAGLNFLGEHGIADLHRLNVKEVVDLRDPLEIEQWPYTLPDDIHVDRVPLLKTTMTENGGMKNVAKGIDMAEMYHDIVFGSAEQIVLILRKLLKDDGHPMLIHCTAGKDRTGITAGILMSLLGVSDDMVVSCYAQSGANLGDAFKKAVLSGLTSDEKGVGQITAAQTAMLASPPELMRGVLVGIKSEYGDVEQYCLQNGMSADEVAGLRALFVL